LPGAFWITTGAGAVWVVADAKLFKLDPTSNTVGKAIDLSEPADAHVTALATDDAVWVALPDLKAVARVDPAAGTVGDFISVGVAPFAMAIDGNDLWVTSDESGVVLRIDLPSGRVVSSIDVDRPTGIAVGAGSVWVTEHELDNVTRIDPATNKRVKDIVVGDGPGSIAFSDDTVWVQNTFGGTLSRIDPATDTEVAQVDLHTGGAFAVEARPGAVWVTTSGPPSDDPCASAQLVRLVPRTNTVVGAVSVPCAVHVAADETGVWVTEPPLGAVMRVKPAP
jgi:YVTN family beta-propeller protein